MNLKFSWNDETIKYLGLVEKNKILFAYKISFLIIPK